MKSVSTPPIGAVVLKEGNALTLGPRMAENPLRLRGSFGAIQGNWEYMA